MVDLEKIKRALEDNKEMLELVEEILKIRVRKVEAVILKEELRKLEFLIETINPPIAQLTKLRNIFELGESELMRIAKELTKILIDKVLNGQLTCGEIERVKIIIDALRTAAIISERLH